MKQRTRFTVYAMNIGADSNEEQREQSIIPRDVIIVTEN